MTTSGCSADDCDSRTIHAKGMCVKHYQAAWYRSNAERLRERQRKWREDNREYHRESVRRWRKENPRKAREAARRSERTDAARERHRRYRKRNPEQTRRQNSTPAARARQRLNKLKRRDESTFDDETKAFALVLLRDPCAYCGGEGGEWDHIVPLSADGANDWTNLTGACRSCNAQKHTKPLLRALLDAC